MEVPETLAHLITINVDFGVLLCLSPSCKRAVSSIGIDGHMRNIHHYKPAIRKQINGFVQDLISQDTRFQCNYTTVQLPADGSIPQLVVPVVGGFSCQECRFLTTNRDNIRKHVNREHLKKRKKDGDIFNCVQLQTWFGNKRERYWVVDESKELELGQQLEQEDQEQEQDRQLEPEPELGQLGRLYNTTAISH